LPPRTRRPGRRCLTRRVSVLSSRRPKSSAPHDSDLHLYLSPFPNLSFTSPASMHAQCAI
jgi:hypothetical protein